MNSIMATRATKAREDSAWPMERTRQVPSLSAVSLAQNWRPGQKKGDKVHDRMRADEVRTERQTVGWCRWCSVGDLCHTRALRNRKAGECCGSTSIRERNDAEVVVADVAWSFFCANKRKHGAVRISELRGGYAAGLRLCAKPVGFVSQRASQRQQHITGRGWFVGPLVKHS